MREVSDILKISLPLVDLHHGLFSAGPYRLQHLKDQLLSGIPFGYLLNFSEFYNNRFYVDERVLIPRPETEYLVELLLKKRQEQKSPFKNMLDVGTGSGVILLSLLTHDFAIQGSGSDISPDALAVAKMNASRLRVVPEFFLADRLQGMKGGFDVIVSNPPYIKQKSHQSGVHQSVDQHEPHLALYLGDEDYESWFMTLFQDVFKNLQSEGLFMMEGHEAELLAQAEVLRELKFSDVKVLSDLSGRNRFLEAYKR